MSMNMKIYARTTYTYYNEIAQKQLIVKYSNMPSEHRTVLSVKKWKFRRNAILFLSSALPKKHADRTAKSRT